MNWLRRFWTRWLRHWVWYSCMAAGCPFRARWRATLPYSGVVLYLCHVHRTAFDTASGPNAPKTWEEIS